MNLLIHTFQHFIDFDLVSQCANFSTQFNIHDSDGIYTYCISSLYSLGLFFGKFWNLEIFCFGFRLWKLVWTYIFFYHSSHCASFGTRFIFTRIARYRRQNTVWKRDKSLTDFKDKIARKWRHSLDGSAVNEVIPWEYFYRWQFMNIQILF